MIGLFWMNDEPNLGIPERANLGERPRKQKHQEEVKLDQKWEMFKPENGRDNHAWFGKSAS